MKNKIFSLLFAIVACTDMLFAESGTCGDNVTWDLTDSVLTINGTGTMNDFSYVGETPWSSIRYSIKSLVVADGVTRIGSVAFSGCTNITSVTIPNSITSIGGSAFNGCSKITSVHISDIAVWCAVALSGQSSNPLKSTSKLYINDDLITDLVIPSSVTSIGKYAFYNWGSITSIEIPNSVTSIGYQAFYGCSGLTSIEIPNSVTNMGEGAFDECTGLPVIDNIRYADTYLIRAVDKTLSSYSIKQGTKWIDSYAFYNCTSLSSIEIPNSVISIGYAAFYGCNNLTSIDIPNSVTGIRDFAFSCGGLSVITNHATIPQTISSSAFKNVNKTVCTLYVPEESIELYQTADGWKDFTNIVKIPTSTWNVTFVDYDESILSQQEVEDGDAATPPANPSRDWYTFTGWDKDFSAVTSDLTVTAQYEEGQTLDNTIFFINGTNDSEISTQAIEIDFPTPPTIAGFTFLKWRVLAGDIEDGINIQAVYESNTPTSAPSVYTNPTNPAQKLIRDGSVYILTDDSHTYTITGQKVR